MSNLNSKSIQLDNLNVHYLTGGYGEPIVIVHGGGSGSSSWLQTAENLSKSHTIYAPDLPGFGDTGSTGNKFNLLDFVSFIEHFSNSLGLESFSLIGHSIGGYIAAQYALHFPKKVRRLILVGSLGLGREIALWVRVLSSAIFRKGLGQPLLKILSIICKIAHLLNLRFKCLIPFYQLKMDIGKNITNLKGQTIVLMNKLSELIMPTLIIWGANDNIVPFKHAYAAAQVIPKCEVHVFEDCSHSVQSQKAGDFSELLSRFLG